MCTRLTSRLRAMRMHFKTDIEDGQRDNLVKKILEREADWEKEWSEMQLTIMRVMWRHCHALPVENARNVVRECRAHWLRRSFSGPHDSHWKGLNLGTKRIERVIVS